MLWFGLFDESYPVLFCKPYPHVSCCDFPLPVFVFILSFFFPGAAGSSGLRFVCSDFSNKLNISVQSFSSRLSSREKARKHFLFSPQKNSPVSPKSLSKVIELSFGEVVHEVRSSFYLITRWEMCVRLRVQDESSTCCTVFSEVTNPKIPLKYPQNRFSATVGPRPRPMW